MTRQILLAFVALTLTGLWTDPAHAQPTDTLETLEPLKRDCILWEDHCNDVTERYKAAAMSRSGEEAGPYIDGYTGMLRNGCLNSDPVACVTLAELFMGCANDPEAAACVASFRGKPEDDKRTWYLTWASFNFRKACEEDSLHGCVGQIMADAAMEKISRQERDARLAKLGVDVATVDITAVEATVERKFGYYEKPFPSQIANAVDLCADKKDSYQDACRSQIAALSDLPSSLETADRKCRQGGGRSDCVSAYRQYLDQINDIPELDDRIGLYTLMGPVSDLACRAGHADACATLMYEYGTGSRYTKTDFIRALPYYREYCRTEKGPVCLDAEQKARAQNIDFYQVTFDNYKFLSEEVRADRDQRQAEWEARVAEIERRVASASAARAAADAANAAASGPTTITLSAQRQADVDNYVAALGGYTNAIKSLVYNYARTGFLGDVIYSGGADPLVYLTETELKRLRERSWTNMAYATALLDAEDQRRKAGGDYGPWAGRSGSRDANAAEWEGPTSTGTKLLTNCYVSKGSMGFPDQRICY